MPSSLSLDAHFHRGATLGKEKLLSNRILSQFVKPTPNTFYSLCPAQARAYSDLLSNTVIGLDFPDPFSSGLPFRDTHSKSRKAMSVVELATIATTFVSRGPLHSLQNETLFGSFDIESDSYININTDDPVPDFAFLATLLLSTNRKGISLLKRKENLMLFLRFSYRYVNSLCLLSRCPLPLCFGLSHQFAVKKEDGYSIDHYTRNILSRYALALRSTFLSEYGYETIVREVYRGVSVLLLCEIPANRATNTGKVCSLPSPFGLT